MKKHNIKWFLNIITLLSFYDLFKNLKDTTLSIQPYLTKPAFTDLNPDDYCYLFVVKLDRYKESCNTFDNLSDNLCDPN